MMIFWIVLMLLVFAAAVGCLMYLCKRLRKFEFIDRISKEGKIKRFIPLFIIMAVIALLTIIWSMMNAVVIVIALSLFTLIFDAIGLIIKKIIHKESKIYWQGICAIILTVLYFSIGWYSAHIIKGTTYNLTTDKNIDGLKIIFISDSHVGATFDGDGFSKNMDIINAENPDIVFVVGDYVDDSSSYDDMVKASAGLGKINARYGVYFVFGNHDKGYGNGSGRGYSEDEIKLELTKNNVNILEDESILIDNSFYVIGRQDKIESDRASMEELTKNLDKSKYMIVLDHQPQDYNNQANAGVDLVLSGHTHGGQFYPVNGFGEWVKINDRTYGHEKRNKTDFIVSSGIGDWELKFKTGCISEYVIVNIN